MQSCLQGTTPDVQPTYDVLHEREFYKYFQPVRLGLSDHQQKSGPSRTRVSPDRALTAFTQLAALRLNCKRAIISFFDRDNQYILAEATRSLSLQTDFVHAPGDQIDFGVCVAPKRGGICENSIALPFDAAEEGKDDSIFVVPDLSQDDRFRDKPFATAFDWKFYAGVPITSPNGYRIGAFCVVDDSPRDRLEPAEVAFLKDLSTTVMIHMDMLRSQSESMKGERMVHGLGRFVDGKDTLGDWRAQGGDWDEMLDLTENPASRWSDRQYSSHHEERPVIPTGGNDKQPRTTNTHLNITKTPLRRASGTDPVQPSTSHEDPKAKKTSPSDNLAPEVKATFGRAACVIRESLQIDAVVIFDATAKSTFGGLVDRATHERPKRRKVSSASEESVLVDSESGQSDSDDGVAEVTKKDDEKLSEILGFSTPDHNSLKGDQSTKLTDGMTEGFIRSLLRRYPHGKILNFDDEMESTLSQDTTLDETQSLLSSKHSLKKRKRLRPNEAKMIKQTCPGVRSLAIVPMWDADQKFFSACIVWTKDPHRVLTTHSELSYLAAFSDCTMSEVARLNANIADKAKSDFISSISHELRSPLHGILGSVECLQDSSLDTFQENLVHTMETCGKTLLDTIDHLLDFAKINNFTRKSTQHLSNSSDPHAQQQNFALDVDVDLSVVTEEVLETVFAGHDFIKAGRETEQMPRANKQAEQDPMKPFSENNVSVVVDISKAKNSHWVFRTQAGAWRRILMNLFGNSLKYTERGFIQIKLDSEPLPKKEEGGSSRVTLSVTDSGKGMSKEYLDKHIFTPFEQEDSMQPGTGLGLAITSAIVKSMGGEINVESEPGKGTKTTVTLMMMHTPIKEEDIEHSVISIAAKRTKGMKIGFIGFDADSYKKEPEPGTRSPDNALHRFMASFHRMCKSWFSMNMVITSGLDQMDVDVFLTTEKGLSQVQDQLEQRMKTRSDRKAQSEEADIPLLVICNSVATANAMMHQPRTHIAGVLSQPCGPRKLAKSLTLCLEAYKNSKEPGKPLPSMTEVLNSGQDKDLQDGPFRRVMESANNALADEAAAKGHTGDAPLQHPHEDTLEMAQGKTKVPKLDTTHLEGNANLASPAPLESTSPFSKSSSDSEKLVRKVLLVDDNKINLQLLVTYIRKSGHAFMTANNGLEALEAYKSQCEEGKDGEMADSPFDYVLMDLSMPVMDGLTSTRNIRAHERANRIKPTTVIALTGLASASAQQEAFGSGVDTFMTKPVKLKELGKMLEKDNQSDGGGNTEKTSK